jgi:hypothetical protein
MVQFDMVRNRPTFMKTHLGSGMLWCGPVRCGLVRFGF